MIYSIFSSSFLCFQQVLLLYSLFFFHFHHLLFVFNLKDPTSNYKKNIFNTKNQNKKLIDYIYYYLCSHIFGQNHVFLFNYKLCMEIYPSETLHYGRSFFLSNLKSYISIISSLWLSQLQLYTILTNTKTLSVSLLPSRKITKQVNAISLIIPTRHNYHL